MHASSPHGSPYPSEETEAVGVALLDSTKAARKTAAPAADPGLRPIERKPAGQCPAKPSRLPPPKENRLDSSLRLKSKRTHAVEDDVVGRDPVGRDKEQPVVLLREGVDVADLATGDELEAGAVGR